MQRGQSTKDSGTCFRVSAHSEQSGSKDTMPSQAQPIASHLPDREPHAIGPDRTTHREHPDSLESDETTEPPAPPRGPACGLRPCRRTPGTATGSGNMSRQQKGPEPKPEPYPQAIPRPMTPPSTGENRQRSARTAAPLPRWTGAESSRPRRLPEHDRNERPQR